MTDSKSKSFVALFIFYLIANVHLANASDLSARDRIKQKTSPAIFQAWNPIKMAGVSLSSNKDRIVAASRHSMLWEEPVSQLGYGVDLVLGAIWDHKHGGLAKSFTKKSRKLALKNRKAMLKLNPKMIFLMEIRWKDAPGSYLPENSELWIRQQDGSRKPGWMGGPEPYYYLNYEHPKFQKMVEKQARIAVESGVYDGIMLDWWGSHGDNNPKALAMLKAIRAGIGEDAIIVANNDRIAPLPNSKHLINGAFMEMHDRLMSEAGAWDKAREDLLWFEENMRKPTANCFEVQAGSKSRLSAGLTLALTHSDAYFLHAELDNRDKSPDHLHRWHEVYDHKLGKALGEKKEIAELVFERKFENGVVIYNHSKKPFSYQSQKSMKALFTNKQDKSFYIFSKDGEILLW